MGADVSPGMSDDREPRKGRRTLRKSQRRGDRGEERPLTNAAQVRFVYEHELKGEWFRVAEALDLPVYPHPEHTVVRLEFRDNPGSD